MMNLIKLLLLLLPLLIVPDTSSANECKFSVESIQIGDTIERVKEKKVGWDYRGLQTSKDESLVATFHKSISDVSMENKWCICVWVKTIGVYFDKQEKVDSISLVISNTISKEEVVKQCDKVDFDKCINYGSSLSGKILADLVLRYGNPVEEKNDNFIKSIWKDKDYNLTMIWSPMKTILNLRKGK
jgi:hypothetical protein